MKLIDRHILKNFLLPFVFILVSLLGLFLVYDLSSKIARFLEHHVSVLTILSFYALYMPQLIALGLPMVILMAIVLGIGKMTSNSEITAMRACGVSVRRIARPLLATGLLLAGLGFVVFEKVVTKTYGVTERFEQTLKGRTPVEDIIPEGDFLTDESGSLLHFGVYRPKYQRFEGVSWKKEIENPGGEILIRADRAVWMEDEWWAFGRVKIIYPDGTHSPSYRKMPLYEWRFRPKEVTAEKFPEEMTMAELRKNIRKFRISPGKVRELQIQLHRRVALPILNLLVVAVALPFALRGGRHGGSVAIGVGICMLLCLGYYGLSVLLSLIRSLPPSVSVWSPNLLFGLGGLIATFRLD
jgi:lipopolysaccharide export system permease protein